jgi:hypothetical protein
MVNSKDYVLRTDKTASESKKVVTFQSKSLLNFSSVQDNSDDFPIEKLESKIIKVKFMKNYLFPTTEALSKSSEDVRLATERDHSRDMNHFIEIDTETKDFIKNMIIVDEKSVFISRPFFILVSLAMLSGPYCKWLDDKCHRSNISVEKNFIV